LSQPILLLVLFATLLVGAALFVMLQAETRREVRQARLKAIMAGTATPADSGLGLSLRRPIVRRGRRAFSVLPGVLWERLNAEFSATGSRIRVLHLVMAAGIAAAVVITFSVLFLGLGPGLALPLTGAAALLAPVFVLRYAQRQYQSKFLAVFPDALDLLGRAVKAGLPVFDAMEVAAREIPDPVGAEFRKTLEEVRIGVEIDEALRHTAGRIRIPDFHFYMVALVLQRRTGGSLAETLGNLSAIIRRRKELRLKVRALTAEAKASVIVLSVLPFLTAVGMLIIAPDLMRVLLTDPRGRFMIGVALVSQIVGIIVMSRMIKRSLR
jgi:tight adherence protein B